MDRVYKEDIPALRKALEKLKDEFSSLSPKTNWTRLRVDPLLIHVRKLERLLRSGASPRLTKGVVMFHSDLVYLRENVRALNQILQTEKESLRRKSGNERN